MPSLGWPVGVEIRPAEPADRPALARLLASEDIAAVFDDLHTAAEIAGFVEELLKAASAGRVQVLARDGAPELLGYAGVANGWLSYGVLSAYRRSGFASRLIEACCADGATSVEAAVRRDNAGSARLLERLGFRFVGAAPACGSPASLLRYVRSPRRF